MAYLLATVRPLWHAQQTARPQWMCRQKLKASITDIHSQPRKERHVSHVYRTLLFALDLRAALNVLQTARWWPT